MTVSSCLRRADGESLGLGDAQLLDGLPHLFTLITGEEETRTSREPTGKMEERERSLDGCDMCEAPAEREEMHDAGVGVRCRGEIPRVPVADERDAQPRCEVPLGAEVPRAA